MAQHIFEIGDVVRLKSGGPAMTFESCSQKCGSVALCVRWDARSGTFVQERILTALLQKSQPDLA